GPRRQKVAGDGETVLGRGNLALGRIEGRPAGITTRGEIGDHDGDQDGRDEIMNLAHGRSPRSSRLRTGSHVATTKSMNQPIASQTTRGTPATSSLNQLGRICGRPCATMSGASATTAKIILKPTRM